MEKDLNLLQTKIIEVEKKITSSPLKLLFGIHYWVSLKTYIYEYEMTQGNDLFVHKSEIKSITGLKFIFISLLNYVKSIFFQFNKRAFFLGASSGLFEKDGKIWDSYFPYRELGPEQVIYCFNAGNFQKLQKDIDYIFKYSIIMENFLVGPLKVIFAQLAFKVRKFFLNTDDKALKQFFNDFSAPANSILFQYFKFYSGVVFYLIFFIPFFSVKKAYVVSSYSKSDMIAALKILGITVIEMQHGFLGPSHNGYNYDPSLRGHLPTPDKVYVYNNFFKSELERGGFYLSHQIFPYGRLKYELINKNKSELDLPENYVVFTGQGLNHEKIKELLYLNSSVFFEKYSFIYQPHPNEKSNSDNFKEAIEKISPKVIFYQGKATTEELIFHSKAHLSIFSSCHFDAIQYLGKTYIFNTQGSSLFDTYVASEPKIFLKFNCLNDLLDTIG